MEPYISFKLTMPYEKRRDIAERIIQTFPHRVPVIVEPAPKAARLLDRVKYLAPKDITVAKFTAEIRKHCKVRPSEGLFMFFGTKTKLLQAPVMSMGNLYDLYRDDDLFLYCSYSQANTFGGV